MKNIKYLVMLVMLALSSFNSIAQEVEKELKTESDGFQWYQLWQYQNGKSKYGAQSMGGVTFIPLSRGYTFICYQGGSFSVSKGDKKNGVCDITGREIIAPGRYDYAGYWNEDGFEYYSVELNGKKGICDKNGREIIAPRYESLILSDGVFEYKDASGKWVSTGIKPDGTSGGTSYASNTSSTSYSYSTTSNSNGESSLLYEGEYTIQYSQSRDLINGYSTGQYSSDETERVKIYEDHLAIHFGTHCKYKSTNSSGERVYEGAQSIGGTVTAYVSPSYNIRLVNESWFNGVHMKVGIPVVKGRSLMPEYSGGYGGGTSSGYQPTNNNNGSTGTSSGSKHGSYVKEETCPACHGTKTCETCLGRGWRNNPFTNQHDTCPICRGRKTCQTCNGSGKVSKTVYY